MHETTAPRFEDPSHPLFRAYIAAARVAERYFRYEVSGLERLRDTETSLLVCYHGGPFPWDLFMLWAKMHDELHAAPLTMAHRLYTRTPGLRSLSQAAGYFKGPPSEQLMQAARAHGRHFLVAPGGMREGLRPFWKYSKLSWAGRQGWLRFALASSLKVIPIASGSAEWSYLGLVDGDAASRRLFGKTGLPVWTGIGLGGLWPLTLPIPVHVRQAVGEPIDVVALKTQGRDDEDWQRLVYERVAAEVQRLVRETGGGPLGMRRGR